jgi:DNA-binding transcriptional LysR family regulator
MELKWLEDFVTLAAMRNFSRAAEARAVTQPAFSRRIRTLEQWLGASLFRRSPHGVELTPAGEELLRGADDLIRRIMHIRQDVRQAGGREPLELRFAATHALSFTFFPHWMREVELGAQAGAVRLISDSMQACEELMLLGQAQFLLCHHHPLAPGRCTEPHFHSVTVGQDALVPYVAPDDSGAPRWRLGTGAHELPTLSYSAESGLGRIVAARRFQDRESGLRTVFSAHLAAALRGMACDGRGLAWLPATLAQHDFEAGRLVRAGGSEWDVPMEIRVFRPAALQTPAAESFWTRLQRH